MAANRQNAEVEFEANGKSYVLRYGAWPLAQIEDDLDRPFGEILDELNGEDSRQFMGTIISVFWGGLLELQEGIEKREVGRILDDLGFEGLTDLMRRAIVAAFPEMEGAGSGTENPTKGKRPTTGNRKARRAAKKKAGT